MVFISSIPTNLKPFFHFSMRVFLTESLLLLSYFRSISSLLSSHIRACFSFFQKYNCNCPALSNPLRTFSPTYPFHSSPYPHSKSFQFSYIYFILLKSRTIQLHAKLRHRPLFSSTIYCMIFRVCNLYLLLQPSLAIEIRLPISVLLLPSSLIHTIRYLEFIFPTILP